ncbi:MAG: hypothetical protein WHX52_02690 [Anaerolineae bacterium]
MWIIAEYEAVTLFSLKLSAATASGGKTLLVPTPYTLKMALLDAACRTVGAAQAETWWPTIRDLRVALCPAERVVVTNLFQKVLKPRRSPAKPDDPEAGPFQKTIGYREYAQLLGPWQVALGGEMLQANSWLEGLLLNVSYLGKRGGFVQLTSLLGQYATLPAEFVELTATPDRFAFQGTLQVLDDCAPTLTFAKANIYSGEQVKLGKERVTRNVVLPYRVVQSSKSFTLYERL